MKTSELRQKIRNNELTIGSWITIGHPAMAEILSEAGFDWLVIDMEHSSIDHSMMQYLIMAIQSKGIPAIVRVSKNEEVIIKKALDSGADGIIVPMVCSEQDAKDAVGFAKYPPEGKRGVGLARAQHYGFHDGFNKYKQFVHDDVIVIAQIEHINGINNLDAILKTPGIDGTIIGPYDLSGSLGIPGQFDDEKVVKALDKFKATCDSNHVNKGFHVVNSDPAKIKEKIDEGYRFVAYGTDYLFMGDTAIKGMSVLKSM